MWNRSALEKGVPGPNLGSVLFISYGSFSFMGYALFWAYVDELCWFVYELCSLEFLYL